MSFGKKSSTPATPQPTATPVASSRQTEINRYATNPEARDRAAGNAGASLLAPPEAETDEMKRAKLLQGGGLA